MKKIQTRAELDILDGSGVPSKDAEVVFWLSGTAQGRSGRSVEGTVTGWAPNDSHLGRSLALSVLCIFGWIPPCLVGATMHWTVGLPWVTVLTATVMTIAIVVGAYFVMKPNGTKTQLATTAGSNAERGSVVVEVIDQEAIDLPAARTESSPLAAAAGNTPSPAPLDPPATPDTTTPI